jgi:hypothetical protein
MMSRWGIASNTSLASPRRPRRASSRIRALCPDVPSEARVTRHAGIGSSALAAADERKRQRCWQRAIDGLPHLIGNTIRASACWRGGAVAGGYTAGSRAPVAGYGRSIGHTAADSPGGKEGAARAPQIVGLVLFKLAVPDRPARSTQFLARSWHGPARSISCSGRHGTARTVCR